MTSSTTTISKQLTSVWIFPQVGAFSNVLGRVDWQLHFEREGAVSVAAVETLINLDDLEAGTFVDIESLTTPQALELAYQPQGGDDFVDHLRDFHEGRLDYLIQQQGLIPWTLNDQAQITA